MQKLLPTGTKVELNDGSKLIVGGYLGGFNDGVTRYIGFVDVMKMFDGYGSLGKDYFFFEQSDISRLLSVGKDMDDVMLNNYFRPYSYQNYDDPYNNTPLAEACREYIKEKNNSSDKQRKF